MKVLTIKGINYRKSTVLNAYSIEIAEKAVSRSVFLTTMALYFECRINKKRTPFRLFFGDLALFLSAAKLKPQKFTKISFIIESFVVFFVVEYGGY